MDDPAFYQRLRALIGRRCILPDGEWQILDVLEQDASIVLQRISGRRGEIQADAYGNPTRRAPETRVVRFTDDEGNVSQETKALLNALQRS